MRLADVRPVHASDVLVEGERVPGHLHVIERPDGRVLVDTGMIDSTPELDEDWHPTTYPERIPRDVALVINTHLHFDHCGGNRLFPGIPIHVQRRELEAAREPDYTIPEWVDFDGATYVELDGEAEIVPGVRVLPTPGHTPGHQSVLVDTDDGLVVVAGDVAYRWEDFDAAAGPLLGLGARRIWLAHETEPRDG
ncbi:MAG TPA: N-acyl homoserine lactonase family protein [Gaiellaceae bacterium]|jgi:N-acyl homoserine lactone hydrolase|nr:N-acyl homoserine lactonase family protein [Gaiellaceae bacterium]